MRKSPDPSLAQWVCLRQTNYIPVGKRPTSRSIDLINDLILHHDLIMHEV